MRLNRLTLVSLLILAFAPAVAAQKPGHIETKYDRFDDRTLVQLDVMQVVSGKYDGIYISANYACKGDVKNCKPEKILLGILVLVKGGVYDGSGDLTVLADAERFPIGAMTRAGSKNITSESNVTRTLFGILISYDTFSKIVQSKKVEMRLDTTEFELTDANLDALRKLRLFYLSSDDSSWGESSQTDQAQAPAPQPALPTQATLDAIKALRKVNGATEVGITFLQYGPLLVEAKGPVDEALAALPEGELRREIQSAMEDYVLAGQAWSASLQSSGATGVPTGSELARILNERYSLGLTLKKGRYLNRQQILQIIWKSARTHIENASSLSRR